MELSEAVYRLRELVEVENNIVTYKSLSHVLHLPTTTAKRVLQEYVYQCRRECVPISVTYALSGITESGDVLLSLVIDNELEGAKATLLSINGLHVYSVSMSKIKCCDPLIAANYCSTTSSHQTSLKPSVTETLLPQLSFMPARPDLEVPSHQYQDKQCLDVTEESKEKAKIDPLSIKPSKQSPIKSPRKRGRPSKTQDSSSKQTSILNFFKSTT